MGKGGLACAAPFPKSCAQIWAQDSGCSLYNRSNQQNFKNEKFIVDYHMPPRRSARLLIRLACGSHVIRPIPIERANETLGGNDARAFYCLRFDVLV